MPDPMETLKELLADGFRQAMPVGSNVFELLNSPITLSRGTITLRYNGIAFTIIAPRAMKLQHRDKDIRILCEMGDVTSWWYENRLTDIRLRILQVQQVQQAQQDERLQRAAKAQAAMPIVKQDAATTAPLPDLLVAPLPIAIAHILRSQQDPFTCLGIPSFDVQRPDVNVLHRRYRSLASRFHPDKCSDPMAEDVFKAIANAAKLIELRSTRVQAVRHP